MNWPAVGKVRRNFIVDHRKNSVPMIIQTTPETSSAVPAGLFILLVTLVALFTESIGHSQGVGETPSAVHYAGIQGNTMCPVLPDEPALLDIHVEYEGSRVFFCCMRCRKQFIDNPEAYLDNIKLGNSVSGVHSDRVHFIKGAAGHEHTKGETVHADGSQDTAPAVETGHTSTDHHDHASDHQQAHGLWSLVQFIGKFHPVVVHFPIALVIAAALAEVLFGRTGRLLFSNAARYSVALAGVSVVVTVALGWAAGAFARYPGEGAWLLTTHRWLGTAAGLLVVLTAVLSEYSHRRSRRRFRVAYRWALFAGVLLVGVTGHFGASLIYGFDYFAK